MTGPSATSSSATRRAALTARWRQVVTWADSTVVGRVWQRLLELEFVDRSVALAAKAFVSLFPLLVVAASVSPASVREGILQSLQTRFGIDGEAMTLVRGAFAAPDQVKSATGVFGVVLAVLYAASFATAIQRIYLRSWRRPPRGGLRDKRRGLVWLGGVLAFLGLIGTVARVVTGAPGTITSTIVGLVAAPLLWWWTAHTMLRGDVRWRPLLPTAVVTGLGAGLYAVAASVWMPRVLLNNVAQFGFVGVALSMVTWFVGFAFLVVVASALGPALSEGDDPLARWLRGPDDDTLNPGAAPALSGPDAPKRLRDLLGAVGAPDSLDET